LETQQRLGLNAYNSAEIGSEFSGLLLSLLVGPTRYPPTLSTRPDMLVSTLEFMLQGSAAERQKAVALARGAFPDLELPLFQTQRLARAHVEFWAGSQKNALDWARRTVRGVGVLRKHETDESVRMSGDFEFVATYQTIVSDVLESAAPDANRLEFALQVTEQLRARVLLERLAALERPGAEQVIDEPPTVTEIQETLSSDEALVSFMVWAPRPSKWTPYARGHSSAWWSPRTTSGL
jgi:hypothetical protein